MAHLLIYLAHYVIARLIFDELVRHGVSPLAAFVLAAVALYFLRRRRRI